MFNGRPRVLTQVKSDVDEQPDNGNDASDEEEYFLKRCCKSGGPVSSVWEEIVTSHEAGDFDESKEFEFDEEDLITQVDEFAKDASNININEEDISEESGPRIKDAKYIFCPPEHCLPILRLFAKHHALHPLLAERHGQPRSPEQIYEDCVLEMYSHCKRNNLCEVWAYMWNSWYAPSKWKLWAHSGYPKAIPRKRTTMMVEAVWYRLKQVSLALNHRPRLDFVIHIIATESVPAYRVTFAKVTKKLRISWTQDLTAEQKSFKRAWLCLCT